MCVFIIIMKYVEKQIVLTFFKQLMFVLFFINLCIFMFAVAGRLWIRCFTDFDHKSTWTGDETLSTLHGRKCWTKHGENSGGQPLTSVR